MSEVQANNEQTRPATATATGAGTEGTGAEGTGTGTWSIFGTGQKTETQQDKPKEPEKDYIKKFEGQTKFIFGDDTEKTRGYVYGETEKKPLKVILKGLYDEYYKKMMDGVIRFTKEGQLNEDVKNMFKRALQALAEKKRIDQAAPPYEFEKSKSVISQMVVYNDEGKDKRLPILIYDPCIFELENRVKPSIKEFHTSIQQKFDKFELVGLLHESMHNYIQKIDEKNILVGGKYVGGGSPPVEKVWEILKGRFAKIKTQQFVIALHDLITDIYINNSLNIEKTVEKKRGFMEYQVIMLMLYIIKSLPESIVVQTIKEMIININGTDYNLMDYVVHILYPHVFNFKKDTFDNDVEKFQQQYPPPPSLPDTKLLFGYEASEFEKFPLPKKITILIINYKISSEGEVDKRKKIKSKLIENIDTVKTHFSEYTLQKDVSDKKYIDFIEERTEKENKLIKLLSKNLDIQYEGVRSEGTSTLESMKKGFANRFYAFGSERKEASAEAGAETSAKEAIPDNILLKHILNFGVWKSKQKVTTPTTPEKLFMIEPKMMEYLLNGEKTDGYISKVFLSINYTQSKVADYWNSAEAAKHIPMVEPSKEKEKNKYYEKNFSFDVYKYEVKGEETQDARFQQSEWYSEYNKLQQTKKGGQSKNTTAKKNKSKRNKSKKNK